MSDFIMLDESRAVVLSEIKTIVSNESSVSFKMSETWLVSVQMGRSVPLSELLEFVAKAKVSDKYFVSIDSLKAKSG